MSLFKLLMVFGVCVSGLHFFLKLEGKNGCVLIDAVKGGWGAMQVEWGYKQRCAGLGV